MVVSGHVGSLGGVVGRGLLRFRFVFCSLGGEARKHVVVMWWDFSRSLRFGLRMSDGMWAAGRGEPWLAEDCRLDCIGCVAMPAGLTCHARPLISSYQPAHGATRLSGLVRPNVRPNPIRDATPRQAEATKPATKCLVLAAAGESRFKNKNVALPWSRHTSRMPKPYLVRPRLAPSASHSVTHIILGSS